eukprot:Em0019g486a
MQGQDALQFSRKEASACLGTKLEQTLPVGLRLRVARGATEATPGKYRICQHRQECSKHSGGKGPGTPSNDFERKLNVCSLRPSILVQEDLRVDHDPQFSCKKTSAWFSPRKDARWVEGGQRSSRDRRLENWDESPASHGMCFTFQALGGNRIVNRTPQHKRMQSCIATSMERPRVNSGVHRVWEVFLCNLEWIGDEMAAQKFPHKRMQSCIATSMERPRVNSGVHRVWEEFLCNLEWIGDEMEAQKFPVKSLTNTTAQKNASYDTHLSWDVFLCNLEWIGDEIAAQKFPRTPQLKKNASYDTHHSWEEFLCNLEWIGDEMEAQKFPRTPQHKRMLVMHCHKHGEAPRELWSPLGRTPQLKKNASYDTHHSWEEFLCNLEWIGDEMEAQKFPRTPQHKRMLVMHCHKHGEAPRELWSPLGRTPQLKKNASYDTHLSWEVFLCNLEWIGDEMAAQKFPRTPQHKRMLVMHCHKHGEASRELWSPSGRTPQLKKNASYDTHLSWEVFLCNLEWIGDEMAAQKFPRTPQHKKNASYDTHLSWEVFLCNLEWIGDEMAAQKFPVKSLSKKKYITCRHFYLANTTAQNDTSYELTHA